ncbi:large conductance mechanosensitive channel protein MscL [Nocardia terpenica]|uniref:Large-conductance mechanosensitive channel n=1 Tax=Nocardia terpenica TaxID=455432 RepID=A0A164JNZ4_9NOCA|nr:large conductance mechanosensitive channel protein MscL [Nocardia terpenica]KZM70584.1 mechanosensitive ion channel protein MscL [Nocardia terpenica]MBF6060358.1 large conductance mechanosensitive channel protein MscL [Nocardia terpenica]MBF6103618.1 large conductance mechanosensitive channel protein MscL [Nocardia terpenica]MBF6112008.1 large conductance mechanosensitive channel protein MscL [Nocardia terpenica]MBF6117839.1 large conductance mechanosensitive channel protein MscL [Nocardia 
MLKGFKDFLLRGNVIDLAVAVVMGTAFVAIVTAFTDGIVNPLLAIFGGTNDLGLGFRIVADKPATYVAVGPIITAAINFVIIAAILYLALVLPATKLRNRRVRDDAARTDTDLLREIRDLLAEGRESAGGRHES